MEKKKKLAELAEAKKAEEAAVAEATRKAMAEARWAEKQKVVEPASDEDGDSVPKKQKTMQDEDRAIEMACVVCKRCVSRFSDVFLLLNAL